MKTILAVLLLLVATDAAAECSCETGPCEAVTLAVAADAHEPETSPAAVDVNFSVDAAPATAPMWLYAGPALLVLIVTPFVRRQRSPLLTLGSREWMVTEKREPCAQSRAFGGAPVQAMS
jgi:hypothetical protein